VVSSCQWSTAPIRDWQRTGDLWVPWKCPISKQLQFFVDENDWMFPAAGGRIGLALTSLDKRENFMLDVTRAQIKLTKATYQNRVRQAIVLMRLDLDGPPHRNPDETEISCPHLHIYREGFGDKWATPAPSERYGNTLDLFSTCEAFMQHCNITGPSKMQKGLFS
jgi:hypothetical protein